MYNYVYDFKRFVESLEYKSGTYYQDMFVKKLTELFPDGAKLYHRTENSNIESIMMNGLDPAYDVKGRDIIHTVLGTNDINRVGGSDTVTLQINIPVSEYYSLYPEEATYFDEDEMCYEDSDEEINWDAIFKIYMSTHPSLIGGDITINEIIPPSQIEVMA